jgi:hypothetical protein
MGMETLLWVGTVVFVGIAIANLVRAMYLNVKFQAYLKEKHYEHWRRIFQDQLVKKALLWPLMRGTPVDFGWKSQEDFGDPKIAEFRRQVRAGFIGFVVTAIAAAAWFAINAFVLSTLR